MEIRHPEKTKNTSVPIWEFGTLNNYIFTLTKKKKSLCRFENSAQKKNIMNFIKQFWRIVVSKFKNKKQKNLCVE